MLQALKKLQFGKNINALEGTIWDKIILFAIPIALTSLLQQMFNSADIATIGRFVSAEALAAMGTTAPLVGININMLMGLSVGVTVIVSQRRGAGDVQGMREAVHTAIVLAIIAGIILMLVGMISAPYILRWMSTPENLVETAAHYLRIYFAGLPFLMLYDFISGIFRANGDTKKPIIALGTGVVANLILNLVFVLGFGMGVDGVALGTSLANAICAGIMFRFIIHDKSDIRVDTKQLCFPWRTVQPILAVGVPTGIQGSVFSLSNMVIQSAINSLGAVAMAASAVSLNFELWAFYILFAFSQTATAFIGLNYGARNRERCHMILKWALIEGIIAALCVSAFFVVFVEQLTMFFTHDPATIAMTKERVYWIVSFECISLVMDLFSAVLRGYGISMAPAAITVVGVCVLRVIYVYTIFATSHTFATLMAVYPISWFVTMCGIMGFYFLVRNKVWGKTA